MTTTGNAPQGTRILLARHAETSAPDRFHGAESDIDLSARGHQQAEQLGRWLKDADPNGALLLGDAGAVDTAAPIGRACGLEPVVIAALHERRIGPLSGVSREEGWATYAETKQRWIAGELEVAHPGGESFADIRRRVGPILEDLAARHRGETIVVVAHGVVIRVALTSLLAGFTPRRLRPDRDRLRLGQRPVVRRPNLDGAGPEPGRRALALPPGGVRIAGVC